MFRASFSNPVTVSFGLILVAAACSSDGSESEIATTQATPAVTPTMMAAPAADEASPSGGTAPMSNDSSEGPPMNVGLTQPPGGSNGGPAAPSSETPNPPVVPAPVPVAAGAPVPSAGCGAATSAAASGRFTIDVAGNPRDFIVALPQGYDAARPYPLVFTWHPGGGTAQGTANNYYGLRTLAANSVIFVSPEGIDNGWANTGGRDLAFLDAMLDRFEGDLCVDQSRIFSTGFSYGGAMSYAIGCGRADVFRAIAPMSGSLRLSGCTNGTAPIAMLGFHGNTDTVVSYASGVAARDNIAGRNGCQPEAMATEANGCLNYQGCSEGHSLTWCEFNGGHMPAPQSAQRIWDFFSAF
ncbi:MAG: Ricin and poly(3-hydroxybutyrate) depolymerase fusion [Deltaproteobacteria bacterium]